MFMGKIAVSQVERTEHSPGAICVEITFDPESLPITIADDHVSRVNDEIRAACEHLVNVVLTNKD